jgi:uncharacterized membrane protein YkoI
MNRNFRATILITAAIAVLGTTTISFAANGPTTIASPAKTVKTTKSATGKLPPKVRKQATLKVSKAKAVKIALKAHPGATIASIKVDGKAYMIQLTSEAGNYTMRIGGNTGRIIRNQAIAPKTTATGTSDNATKAATPTATK